MKPVSENWDNVYNSVVNDFACHYSYFRENCDVDTLWDFIDVDFVRNVDEIREFVSKYV